MVGLIKKVGRIQYTFGLDESNRGFCIARCDRTGAWLSCAGKEAKFLGKALREFSGSYVSDDKRIKISVVKSGGEVILCHAVSGFNSEFKLTEDESVVFGEIISKRIADCVVGNK